MHISDKYQIYFRISVHLNILLWGHLHYSKTACTNSIGYSSVTSVVYILRFTKHILKDSSCKKLAYIRKYYSIIVCEMHQYIKRHLNRHPDASLVHSLNNFRNLRYITINFWCLFRNYQFAIKTFSVGALRTKKLIYLFYL